MTTDHAPHPRIHRSAGRAALLLGLACLWAALPSAMAATDRHRAMWGADPSTAVTLAWDQTEGGDAMVHYGTEDGGTLATAYPFTKTPDRAEDYKGMRSRFARLTGLQPDTAYYYVVADAGTVSRRFWFRTAPATRQPFPFIAGGDSGGNRAARQQANRMVAKLRPLFVAFTGNMTASGTDTQWVEWMNDWQAATGADGRIFPVIPARGAQEADNEVLARLFDLPGTDNRQALTFGGDLLRLYSLNAEMADDAGQRAWLADDLAAAQGVKWRAAIYGRAIRPHTAAVAEGGAGQMAWAGLFNEHGVDLAVEGGSGCMKRTFPLVPSRDSGRAAGFARNDARGTIYIGEGAWGATLRQVNDNKPWTNAGESFNGFDLIDVRADRMEVRTVRTDHEAGTAALAEEDGMALPEGLVLWNPYPSGKVLTVPYQAAGAADGGDGTRLFARMRLKEETFPDPSRPWQPLYEGVDYRLDTVEAPRLLRVHQMRVDLTAAGISLESTPSNGDRELEADRMRTTTFMKRTGVQAAVNTVAGTAGGGELSPTEIVGLAIHDGQVYSPAENGHAVFLVYADNRVEIRRNEENSNSFPGVRLGFGGWWPEPGQATQSMMVDDGVVITRDQTIHPRTGLGLSKDGRYLYMVVIDGRQNGLSEGVTLVDFAEWMRRLGAWDAMNLDGGGSSTMVIEDDQTGEPRILNSPSDGTPAQSTERVVAGHLGIFANPLPVNPSR